jgi:dTDP-4-dehydrorhamnose 3,5-epimerase
MKSTVERFSIPDLLLITPKVFADPRGHLLETYHQDEYRQMGVTCDFVQDNQSLTIRNGLRGLHAQLKTPQAKLVRVVSGEIYDVAVDARPDSPTFGQWDGAHLSGDNFKQLFIPEGFLHGFCVLSETAIVHYKCSSLYDPTDQMGVIWNDPDLAINWPVASPILSEKDLKNITWSAFKAILSK